MKLEKTAKILQKKHEYMDLMQVKRWYIIDTEKSTLYEIWYFIVMVAAIINSIWTPFTISFSYAIEISEDPTSFVYWIDYIANKIFILDIFVHFMASYKDPILGLHVFKPKEIALHYLKNDFSFDFISSIQLRYIGT